MCIFCVHMFWLHIWTDGKFCYIWPVSTEFFFTCIVIQLKRIKSKSILLIWVSWYMYIYITIKQHLKKTVYVYGKWYSSANIIMNFPSFCLFCPFHSPLTWFAVYSPWGRTEISLLIPRYIIKPEPCHWGGVAMGSTKPTRGGWPLLF